MYTAVRELLDVPKAKGNILSVIYIEKNCIMKASNCKDAEAHKCQLHDVGGCSSLPSHFMTPGSIYDQQLVSSSLDGSLCSWNALDLRNGVTNRLTFFANFRDRRDAFVVIRKPESHHYIGFLCDVVVLSRRQGGKRLCLQACRTSLILCLNRLLVLPSDLRRQMHNF